MPSTGAPSAPVRRYRVFLSYSHADTLWARWLMRRLEGYAVPRRFHGRPAPIGPIGSRIAPVFRDRDELPTTSDLGETIRDALRQSAALVVICSPAAARSVWVQEEITAFKRLHGERAVFAFIVAGEPKHAGEADDCFSPALRRELGPDGRLGDSPAEVVAADARPAGDGPKLAFIRLVAGLLGVGFDDLRQREMARRQRRLLFVTSGSLAGMALTLALATVAWQSRNDARRRQEQAEDVLTFMLGEFRADLKKAGQLPLLDKVGDKAIGYFDSLDGRDLSDTALARHVKALTQIGEIRLEQKDARLADAARAFATAYQRAAALAARHPKNGDMLFERAQAEYYLGAVHLKRGNLPATAEWFTRYRDSAVALVALDPGRVAWQRELVSGRHNLAVLDLERGNLAAARAGLDAEMQTLRQLAAAEPKTLHFRFRQADVHSWLGNAAHRAGELPEALRCFTAQRAELEALVALEPQTAQWRFHLANCLIWQSEAFAVTGRLDDARAGLAEGNAVLAPLVKNDPTNRRWLSAQAALRIAEAALESRRDPGRAAALVADVRPALEKLAANEATDRALNIRLVTAGRLEARLRLDTGDPAARAVVERTLAAGRRLSAEARLSNRELGELAHTHLVAGRAVAAQDPATATAAWRAAVDVLRDRAKEASDWCLLDPLARALALLGDSASAAALIARLDTLGYQPLEPWSAFPPASSSTPAP